MIIVVFSGSFFVKPSQVSHIQVGNIFLQTGEPANHKFIFLFHRGKDSFYREFIHVEKVNIHIVFPFYIVYYRKYI